MKKKRGNTLVRPPKSAVEVYRYSKGKMIPDDGKPGEAFSYQDANGVPRTGYGKEIDRDVFGSKVYQGDLRVHVREMEMLKWCASSEGAVMSKRNEPVSPAELRERCGDSLPDFVIDAVNSCLKRGARIGGSIFVRQDDIIEEILRLAPEGTSRESVFESHLLDFEDSFRRVGWSVTYDKPAYCETYPATFEFKAKKVRK